jgi:predicted nucleotidyltransferase
VDIFEAIARTRVYRLNKVSESPVTKIQSKLGCEWPAINKAAQFSEQKAAEIRSILTSNHPLDSEDRSIVAFGSLARNEWTRGSDLDWTLLIDGMADPEHVNIALTIIDSLRKAHIKPPGQTGVFGNLAFSHEIIHKIGGQDDTNRNTTQRILLLLESKVIGMKSDAYDRVIAGILDRYLTEDTSIVTPRGAKKHRVPRFLLNDIVRFWRTMAVDFASKQRERGGKGWALRNLKLRMSRKLIFAAGLLACFSCSLNSSKEMQDAECWPGDTVHSFVNHLKQFVRMTPLEVLAEAILSYQVPPNVTSELFESYDEFLALLGNEDKRQLLEDLNFTEAETNELFSEVRKIGHRFQEGLTKLFYETPKVKDLTISYGVF